jgi:hypothetical protein
MNQLNNYLLKEIFKYLPRGTKMLNRFVCQKWHLLINTKKTTCNNFTDNFKLLQWAYKQGCSWDENTCSYAALHGNFEAIQWLYSHGCPWGTDTCWLGAVDNHFEIIQWAFERGANLDDGVCYHASRNGNLEMLKWARLNKCPWFPDICLRVANYNNHQHIINWIIPQLSL